jgi:Fur family ferric uptake transcriptional regulator
MSTDNKESGKIIRQTSQRKVILEELCKVTSHPTAADVYEMVRKKLPRISLGTVYRNLELLNECGTIQKLDFGEPHKRFDGNASPHYHVNCKKCGRVSDVFIPLKQLLDHEAEEVTGYQITGHHVSFTGICPACRESRKNN